MNNIDYKNMIGSLLEDVGSVEDLRVSLDKSGTVLSFQGTLAINDYPQENEENE